MLLPKGEDFLFSAPSFHFPTLPPARSKLTSYILSPFYYVAIQMRVTLSHLVIGGTSVGALVGFYVQQLAIENWRVSLLIRRLLY